MRRAATAVGALLALAAGTAIALLVLARWLDPPITALQLQRCAGSLFATRSLCARATFVPLGEISRHLPRAVVAAEDARFFQHHGIDWQALRTAASDNLRRGRLWRGGSTLTQQLVKNLFLGTRGGFARKLAEVPLALAADILLSKQRQLELYLNLVEWGPGIYGAERAARYHYDRSARELSAAQAARLAAILPAPQRRTPDGSQRYAEVILRRMER